MFKLRALGRAAASRAQFLAPGALLFVSASAGLTSVAAADEAEHGLHAGQHPWPHDGPFSSYDHASIRRGHQVGGSGVGPREP